MDLRTPWWTSLFLALGLVLVLAGERGFHHTSYGSLLVFSGLALVGLTSLFRGFIAIQARGSHRALEATFVFIHLGILVALLGYSTTTDLGHSILGLSSEKTIRRWDLVLGVVWVIVLACSLVPLLLVEVALGTGKRRGFRGASSDPEASMQIIQIREMGVSGLSIALAAAFLMVTCRVADRSEIRRDVSYFKTSSPGETTRKIVASLNSTLEVHLFFPKESEVYAAVKGYFTELASLNAAVSVSRRDRLTNATLARKFQVGKTGSIAVSYEGRSQVVEVGDDFAKARRNVLRTLDGKVETALLKVMRAPRKVYFTTGHGEPNDATGGSLLGNEKPNLMVFKLEKLIKALNFELDQYSPLEGPVPEDCALLFMIAPATALLEEEQAEIVSYLKNGGAAVIVMDPEQYSIMTGIESYLGVSYVPKPLADDKAHMRSRGGVQDNILLVTNHVASHGSVATLSKAAANQALFFVKPGSFDIQGSTPGLKATGTIKTLESAFRDEPDSADENDYVFGEGEKRDNYPIVVAVEPEDPKAKGPKVVLVGDVDILSDGMLGSVRHAEFLARDLIRWTAGEEEFAGTTNDESDKPIAHTNSQDAKWFYGTILGAPLLLGLLAGLILRRRRTQ